MNARQHREIATCWMVAAALFLCSNVVLADANEQNFDTWADINPWGSDSNADGWVISDGMIRPARGWDAARSAPNSGWLQDYDDSANSWLKSDFLTHGAWRVLFYTKRRDTTTGASTFEIQYSTNDVDWIMLHEITSSDEVWTLYSRQLDIFDPTYIRIMKTGDDAVGQYLGFDDIEILEPPGVLMSNLRIDPGAPQIDESVDVLVDTEVLRDISNVVMTTMYRFEPADSWSALAMTNEGGGVYRTISSIPAGAGSDGTVQYYVEAAYEGYGVSPVFYPEASTNAPATYEPLNPYGSAIRQLSPSSRRTQFIISEIMYNPPPRGDGKNMEFVEIFNTDPVDHDIGGWRIAGDADYTFPEGTILPARSFAVVAADPVALENEHLISGVYGPLSNRTGTVNVLGNGEASVRLRNDQDALMLDVQYDDQWPWPVAADGGGCSLVLDKPDFGEGSPEGWAPSGMVGGSPAALDSLAKNPLKSVVINEFLAHTDSPFEDYIELYNHSSNQVDVTGCALTDDYGQWKYQFGSMLLDPGEHVSFTQTQLGFSLRNAGETIYFVNAARDVVVDAVRFAAQENGIASGRYPDGADAFYELSAHSAGTTNPVPYNREIVINEIMYSPISGYSRDEYVELKNRGGAPVDISDWQFVDGIEFVFNPGTVVPAGGYLVVAKDLTNMLARYSHLDTTNCVGDYRGSLSDRGERIALAKPDNPALPEQDFVVVDEVTYNDGWGDWTDKGGSSIELIDPNNDNRLIMNWAGSDESGKAEWTDISYAGPSDLGNPLDPPDELRVYLLDSGEFLLDDVGVDGSSQYLSDDFEAGTNGWRALGNHIRSTDAAGDGYLGGNAYHLRASGGGNMGTWPNTWTSEPFLNHARAVLSGAPVSNESVTVTAKARWVAGWPFLVMSLQGFWLEVPVELAVPEDLGTPGQINSAVVANAGPAIERVSHSPVLPAGNETVLVTCMVSDGDDVGQVSLRYRVGSSSTTTTVVMVDDGTNGDEVAGDGIYSGRIGAQPSGTLVAFTIDAEDLAGAPATSIYPPSQLPGVPDYECLVKYGLPLTGGSFGTYFILMTQANVNRWVSISGAESEYSNEPIGGTLVYGDYRAIYEAGARWRGLWRGYSDPQTTGAYSVDIPKKNRLFGVTELKLDQSGQGGSDSNIGGGSLLEEFYCYWLSRESGCAAPHLRFVNVNFNGYSRGILHDLQTPTLDFVKSWFDDDDPELYKHSGWVGDPFSIRKDGAGNWKTSRYRFNLRKKKPSVPNDDMSSVWDLANAFATVDDDLYAKRVEAVVDVRGWANYFAGNAAVGNKDAYGWTWGHNMFVYVPHSEKSYMFMYDLDYAYSMSDLWPQPQWPIPYRMFNHPRFRRVYWALFKDLRDGPLNTAKSDAFLDGWYNAFIANGIAPSPGAPTGLKANILTKYQAVSSQLTVVDATFNVSSVSGGSVSSNSVVIGGEAPVEVRTIAVNGLSHYVEFPTVTTWKMRVGLTSGLNTLNLQGLDWWGNPVTNCDDVFTVTFAGADANPVGDVLITEVMYHPMVPGTEFVEVHNRSMTEAYDVSGWRLNGVGFAFPGGSILDPGQYGVVCENTPMYARTYTNAEVLFGEYGGSLDNGGETLQLLKPMGASTVVVAEVRYDDDAPWPTEAAEAGPSLQLVDVDADSMVPGNWAVDTAPMYTPGVANSVAADLPTFEPIFINEILASNVNGAVDNMGDPEPWIELYNAGSNAVDLGVDSYYLTDDPTNLFKWAFAAGTSINSSNYLSLWADGAAGETVGADIHTSFRLNSSSGHVALVRDFAGAPLVIDYLDYGKVGADRSYGMYPEGMRYSYQVFHYPTIGVVNNPASDTPEILINEWMSRNSTTISDPDDNDTDDWFELYNSGTQAVDLAGFSITDDLTDTNQHVIAESLVLQPGEFLIVWADDEPGQNANGTHLHVECKLAGTGDMIALYAPDGTLIDQVSFGAQLTDVGEGRYPDGDEDRYDMPIATPGSSNVLMSVFAVEPSGAGSATLQWRTRVGKQYRVLYSDSLISTNWVVVGDDMPASSSTMSTNVSFSGSSFRVYKIRQMN